MKRNSKHKPVSLHVNPTTVSRPCVSEMCAGFLSPGVADRSFRMWHGGRQQELWGQRAWPLNLQPSAPACFPYHSASQRMGPLRTVPGKNSVPREPQTSLLSGVIQDKSPSGATASPLFQTHGQFPSLLPQEGPVIPAAGNWDPPTRFSGSYCLLLPLPEVTAQARPPSGSPLPTFLRDQVISLSLHSHGYRLSAPGLAEGRVQIKSLSPGPSRQAGSRGGGTRAVGQGCLLQPPGTPGSSAAHSN